MATYSTSVTCTICSKNGASARYENPTQVAVAAGLRPAISGSAALSADRRRTTIRIRCVFFLRFYAEADALLFRLKFVAARYAETFAIKKEPA